MTTSPEASEREAFEAWVIEKHHAYRTERGLRFIDGDDIPLWAGWQGGRAALRAPKVEAPLDGPGPHEPALLETDAAMLWQARVLRRFLIDRAEAAGDTSDGHSACCYTLKSAVESLLHGYMIQIDWERQDRDEAPQLRREVAKLTRDLELAQQPLSAQMATLNQRVIDLTAQLDAVALSQSNPLPALAPLQVDNKPGALK